MVDGLLGLLERVAAMPVGQPFVGGRSGTLDGPGFAARARERDRNNHRQSSITRVTSAQAGR